MNTVKYLYTIYTIYLAMNSEMSCCYFVVYGGAGQLLFNLCVSFDKREHTFLQYIYGNVFFLSCVFFHPLNPHPHPRIKWWLWTMSRSNCRSVSKSVPVKSSCAYTIIKLFLDHWLAASLVTGNKSWPSGSGPSHHVNIFISSFSVTDLGHSRAREVSKRDTCVL